MRTLTTNCILLLLLTLLKSSAAYSNTDSIYLEYGKKIQLHSKNISDLKSSLDSLKSESRANFQSAKEKMVYKLGAMEWILVLSPFFLFLIMLLLLKKKLTSFDLNQALSEAELPKTTIANPAYSANNILQILNNPIAAPLAVSLLPPTIEITSNQMIYTKSSSRYIAFITSVLTWMIALCLSSFYMYQFLKTNVAPDFNGFSSILLSLGIGVVPYAFNKISSAVK